MADLVLDLYNRALGAAGARATVASQNEVSAEAQTAVRYYSSAMTYVLTRARWNFAQAFAAGVLLNVQLPQSWAYAYAFPDDAVKVTTVQPTGPSSSSVPIFGAQLCSVVQRNIGTQFALMTLAGQRAVMSNQSPVQINYTKLVADLGQWEAQALIGLELVLASKMAIPLSGDKTLARGLLEQAEMAMQSAIMADANEALEVRDLPVDWLEARDCLPTFDQFPRV